MIELFFVEVSSKKWLILYNKVIHLFQQILRLKVRK